MNTASLDGCENAVCQYEKTDEPETEVTDTERKYQITALMESHGCPAFWRMARLHLDGKKSYRVYPVCKKHHEEFVGLIIPEALSQLMQEKWIDYLTPTLDIDYESLYGERYGWA